MTIEYPVGDWLGHPNVGCPFCGSFASTSPNARELVDAHVAAVHPTQLREAIAGEMTAQLDEARESMNKEQLLDLAAGMGLEGLTQRSTRKQIEAAIASRETELATEAAATAETGSAPAPADEAAAAAAASEVQ